MPNNAFIISSVVDCEPKFSKLTEVFLIDTSKILLQTLTYENLSYTEHTFSYSIRPTHTIDIIDPTELKYPTVIHSVTSSSIEHISLPFYVC